MNRSYASPSSRPIPAASPSKYASRGLGRATAVELAAAGAYVVCTGRSTRGGATQTGVDDLTLEGTVTIYDGTAWAKCHAGDFAHVPAGGIHGFRNEDGPAKMLLHFAPGAPREAYFEGLAAGMGRLDGDAYDRFMREHDNTWL